MEWNHLVDAAATLLLLNSENKPGEAARGDAIKTCGDAAFMRAAPALMQSPHQGSLRTFILFPHSQTPTGKNTSRRLHLFKNGVAAGKIGCQFNFWERLNQLTIAQSLQTHAIFALSVFIEKNQTPHREHMCAL